MNNLIPINYDNDRQTVSARMLHEKLDNICDFKEFYIAVSKLKVDLLKSDLRILRDTVNTFCSKFGADAIVYLADCITAEMILPCKSEEVRQFKEKQLQNELLINFNAAFPKYYLLGSEIPVDGIGRIDILAEETETGREIIFELKVGSGNPNKQLIAYASKFNNPILIGVTEFPINDSMKLQNVIYLTFDEIKKSSKQWLGVVKWEDMR